jgi:hypothetical protein
MSISADQIAGILSLLGGRNLPTGNDLRRAPRVQLEGNVELTPCPFGSPPPSANSPRRGRTITAKLDDISPRGIGIVLSAPMPVGQQFLLHLPLRDREMADVLCTVQHSKVNPGGGYRIGAEFTCRVDGEAPKETAEQVDRVRQSILG